MEAQLVTAPGDGVSPALLLTLGGRLRAQYLFNVPEGFSRFVLEHRVRPTAGLRAAFATDLTALGGFGGLVMRLRGEGHGQLHVLGPQGTQALVGSLRHFIHWKHPAVLLSELSEWEAPTCYKDEHIAVAALWKTGVVPEVWPAPPWLLSAAAQLAAEPPGTSSSSSEEESSSSEESGSEDSSSSEEANGGSGAMQRASHMDSQGKQQQQQEEEEKGAGPPHDAGQPGPAPAAAAAAPGGPPAPPLSMFDELDQIFMRGAGGATRGGHSSRIRSTVLERLQQAGPKERPGPSQPAPAAANGSLTSKPPAAAKSAAAAAAATAAASGPARRRTGASAPAAAGAAGSSSSTGAGTGATEAGAEEKVYVVGGKPYRELAGAPGISAWVHHKLSSRMRAASTDARAPGGSSTPAAAAAAAAGGQASAAHEANSLLGYLCHIKGSDQLLLVASLHGKRAVAQLRGHPALARLRQQSCRVAGSVLMLDPGMGRAAELRGLLGELPGERIIMERPGTVSKDIGHLAAARTSAKLHLISPTIFPLPASLAAVAAKQQRPVSASQREAGHNSRGPVAGEGHPQPEAGGEGAAEGEQQAAEEPGSNAQPGDSEAGERADQPAATAAAEAGPRVHRITHLSRAVWGAPSFSSVAPAASSGSGPSVPGPPPALRIVPAESFTSEAAAGQGTEGRPSGADPSAVWQELEASKEELPAKLAAVQTAAAAIDKLQSRPRWDPVPNKVQPALGELERGGGSAAQVADPFPQQQQQQHQQAGWQPRPPVLQPAAPGPYSMVGSCPRPTTYPAPQQQPPLTYQQPMPPPLPQLAMAPPYGAPPQQQLYMQPPAAPPGMMWVLQPAPQPFPHPLMAPPGWGGGQALPTGAGPYPQGWPAGSASAAQGPVPPGGSQPLAGYKPPPPPGSPPPPAVQPSGGNDAAAGGAGMSAKRPSAAQQDQQLESNKQAAAALRKRLKRDSGEGGEEAGAGHSEPPAHATAAGPSRSAGPGAAVAAAASGAATGGGPLWGDNALVQGAPQCVRQLAELGDGSQVVFLGTGSAEPSKYRGASAIHLRLDCGQGVLLDCGEGCLGQMERWYGYRAAQRHVAALGCVWLSHRHADHMLGLLGVLGAYPAHLPPLLVVGPLSTRDWLAEAAPHLRLRYTFAHCQELNWPGHWARRQLAERLGLVSFESVPVRHCSDAYGLALGHRDGWRVLYSGDTQPCDRLVQAGRGATLLIHEATFEPCLADQAARKRHSTTAEALAVAQAMGAYRTILTHFSQRYPKFPEGLPDEGSLAASTACAFDGMCVPLAALPLLPALRPAVEYVLAAEEDEATAAAAGGAVVVDGAEVGEGGDGAAGILEAGVQPVQWNP